MGNRVLPRPHLLKSEEIERQKIMAIAQAELGVREITGQNDGKRVEAYLAAVGFKKGAPYCAAFVSWVYLKAGYPQPRTAWSPALFPKQLLTKQAQQADVYGIYFPALKRIAHVGLKLKTEGDWLIGIEANTNVAGSRDGVYRKRRHLKTIKAYANWIPKERRLP